MVKTRLSRRQEKQRRKQLFVIGVGTILLATLLIFFGVPLLVNMAVLLGKMSGGEEPRKTENRAMYIAPPTLEPTYTATHSAEIAIVGSASENQTIKLYVNDTLVDETTVDDSNRFEFEDVRLDEGENVIEALATVEKAESDYSDPIRIMYLKDPPELEISYPTDGQTVSRNNNPVTVTGKTASEVKVTVNSFWAILENDGSFRYDLPLQDGENTISVVATDEAGNITQKEIKVNLAP